MNRQQSERGLRELLQWAEAYYSRTGGCSQVGHGEIFGAFAGRRHRLRTEQHVVEHLNAARPWLPL